MIYVYVVCEGQTEETFIKSVIAPILAYQEIFIEPRLVSTSKAAKGGALNYERVKRYISNCLKENRQPIVTTFFDLYGLNNNFPEYEASQTQQDVYQKVAVLEKAFKQDIVQDNNDFQRRFFPYIQPYEFEGLLFSDIAKLTEIESTWSSKTSTLQAVREEFKTPEHINNSPQTAPSKRLENHLTHPSFRKTLHGTLAIEAIGIDKLLAECRHFSEWYKQLINITGSIK